MIKVYLSAPYEFKEDMVNLALYLRKHKIEVTSTWIELVHENHFHLSQKERRSLALDDIDDICRSNMLLLYSPPDWANKGTGGRHFEAGYAAARKIPILLIGVQGSVMHYHPQIKQITSESTQLQIKEALEQLYESYWIRKEEIE